MTVSSRWTSPLSGTPNSHQSRSRKRRTGSAKRDLGAPEKKRALKALWNCRRYVTTIEANASSAFEPLVTAVRSDR
jgi:hypothetical protein